MLHFYNAMTNKEAHDQTYIAVPQGLEGLHWHRQIWLSKNLVILNVEMKTILFKSKLIQ